MAKLYTIKEISELFRVSKKTIIETIRKNNIDVKIENGKTTYINEEQYQQIKKCFDKTQLSKAHLYTVKEVAEICGVEIFSISRIIKDLNEHTLQSGSLVKVEKGKTTYITEEQLKLIQTKLLVNQANQGNGSSVIKEKVVDAVKKDVAITAVIQAGDIEAMQCLMEHYMNEVKLVNETKKLQSENNQLKHALEYDAVVGWKSWSELKENWKNNFEELKHKINFQEISQKAKLAENEDYKKKIMGYDKFPTTLISPKGQDKLWNYFDR